MSSKRCGRNAASVMMRDGGCASRTGESSDNDDSVNDGTEWDARARSEMMNSDARVSGKACGPKMQETYRCRRLTGGGH